MWGRTSVHVVLVMAETLSPWLCLWGCYATAEWGFLMKCSSFILFTSNRSFILKGRVSLALNHMANATWAVRIHRHSFVYVSVSWLMITPSCVAGFSSSGWTLITCFRFGTSSIPEYLRSYSWNINSDSLGLHDNLVPVNTELHHRVISFL